MKSMTLSKMSNVGCTQINTEEKETKETKSRFMYHNLDPNAQVTVYSGLLGNSEFIIT